MSESLAGRLVSVQVGQPRVMTTKAGRAWESAIVKEAVPGRVFVSRLNVAGDRQADQRHHGGRDKAVCCYSVEHFPVWREELGIPIGPGGFGENFTLEGLTEDKVCVGDVFTVGEAKVQVTQPRIPCSNITRRWDSAELPKRMEARGWTGFYVRVLEEGEVGAGDAVTLRERPHPGWTLARANAILYGENVDRQETEGLAALAALSAEWRRILGRKLRKDAGGSA